MHSNTADRMVTTKKCICVKKSVKYAKLRTKAYMFVICNDKKQLQSQNNHNKCLHILVYRLSQCWPCQARVQLSHKYIQYFRQN